MSLSHSAQMFCPGGRLDCGVEGCCCCCWCCLVSGDETGLSPARAGEDGVITPLCAVGSAISQTSYRTGEHQTDVFEPADPGEKSLESDSPLTSRCNSGFYRSNHWYNIYSLKTLESFSKDISRDSPVIFDLHLYGTLDYR